MPSLYHLNAPPNPFWTFVHDLEDHPFFARQAGAPANPAGEHVAPEAAQASGSGEQARDQQPTAEDPPEVDPASIGTNDSGAQHPSDPWVGRGRFFNPLEGHDAPPRGGHGGRGRGGHMGPPPFMLGGGPWWARHVPGMDDPEHPHPHDDPHHGPGPHHHGPPPHGPPHHGPGPHQHGPPPHGPPHHGPGPHQHGPPPHGPPHHGPPHHGPGPHHQGPPGPHRGRGGGWNRRHSPGGRHGPAEGFNLGDFLNKLGNRLGVDLSGAAENLGLERFSTLRGSGNAESDFEPRGDIFDTTSEYIVHLSLPGAKKSDVGVDWDGENSVLRIAGVVHRPNADEELLSKMVVDQRKREVGAFEKNIRLGTRRDPANIDIAGIHAKMTDGILVVKVPKVEREHKKRDVPISSSPARDEKNTETEKKKESLLDAADEEMYDAAPAPATTAATSPAIAAEKEISEKEQIAAHAYQSSPPPQQQSSPEQDTRSDTIEHEHDHEHDHEEKAPAYEESDWEKDSSGEDEGDYVKINVD